MIVQDLRPRLYILRLVPTGFGCVCIGVFCWLIAFDASESGVTANTFGAFFSVGLPIALVVSLVLLVPLSLVWIISFETLRTMAYTLQARAAVASGVAAATGVATMILFFHHLTDGGWPLVGLLVPSSLLPLFLAMYGTWRSFSKEGKPQ